MKEFKTIIQYLGILFLLSINLSDAYAGGPWLQKKGKGYFQFQSTLLASRYRELSLSSSGDNQGINRAVYSADYGLYGEYGLTDKLDILATIPFKYADVGEQTDELFFPNLLEEGSINGLSNLRFGLKYGILDKDIKVAISAQASFNTVSTDLEKGLATGIQGNAFGLFAHVGKGFGGKWYAFAELGYMKHSNNFSDIIEGRVEVGFNLGSKATIMLSTDIRQSLKNGTFFNENLIQTGLYPNDQEWIASTLKVNFAVSEKVGINFGTTFIPFQLNNVGLAGAFSVGAYVKL